MSNEFYIRTWDSLFENPENRGCSLEWFLERIRESTSFTLRWRRTPWGDVAPIKIQEDGGELIYFVIWS